MGLMLTNPIGIMVAMRARILFLCAFAACSHAQSEDPRSEDPKDLLLRVRDNLQETISRLPRYLCTQTVDRAQFTSGQVKSAESCQALLSQWDPASLRLVATDRLRLDVAIAQSNEIYSWVGESRFDDRDLFQLVREGSLQTGSFATFLSSIFDGSSASFTYDGNVKENGRTLAQFGFEIPKEKSTYVFGNRKVDSIVAYGGTFLVDPAGADLVRLVIRAQLPSEVRACQATTTLDYARVRLNDSSFLLPSQAQLDIINLDGEDAHNWTVYSGCHEFLGEANLVFGDTEAPSQDAPTQAASAGGFQLPSGVAFKVTFTQAIDSAAAAAGDKIIGKLSSPIRDASKKVLVPEGATVTARILKLEHSAGSPPVLDMVVKLETVTVAGQPRPLTASKSSGSKRFEVEPGQLRRINLGPLTPATDRTSGAFEFRNAGDDYVIKSGLESDWTTLAPLP